MRKATYPVHFLVFVFLCVLRRLLFGVLHRSSRSCTVAVKMPLFRGCKQVEASQVRVMWKKASQPAGGVEVKRGAHKTYLPPPCRCTYRSPPA